METQGFSFVERELKFRYLSDGFYLRYKDYPEILQKNERPYSILVIEAYERKFAIPIRSHININNKDCFITDSDKNSGLDFQKSIVVLDESFLNPVAFPTINHSEFNAIKFKEAEIKEAFTKFLRSFISEYKRRKRNSKIPESNRIKYSSLKYFINEIDNE